MISAQNPATSAPNVCALSIDELRKEYSEGSLSPVEVAHAHLERIEAENPRLNAYVTVTAEQALVDAQRAEHVWTHQPEDAPPLLGVPFAIKDLMPTKGIRTSKGSLATSAWIPENNSPLATRLLQAGGTLLGKTTTSELGWKADSGNPVNGPARNPHDPSKTAGGSSGGAAAAVAAGLATVSQGGDGAGSVRIPAAFCGVVGIKPGTGVIPYYPPTPLSSIVANGSFGRTVRDAAILLDVMAGPDPRDPSSVLRHHGQYRRVCDQSPGTLRIAYVPNWGGRRAEPELEHAADHAAAKLRAAGHSVDFIDNSPEDRFDLLHTIWTTGFASIVESAQKGVDAGLARVVDQAVGFSGADLAKAHLQRQVYKAEVAEFFSSYDLLLTPTTSVAAFAAGDDNPDNVNGIPANYLDWAWFTYAFNLSEHPAVSLPHGSTQAGLPTGIQLVAHHGCEEKLVAAAAEAERVLQAAGSRSMGRAAENLKV
ncbi:hypothetical protein LRQ04_16435 [Paenarthrobacter sp. AR 02]|uniref:amidase n=1 Tax=Paenarthrobacter sp. AR 02 TaxID=2899821 RepID=UPI001EEE4E10|nr:amidase family protein [Paenarthrobacter sp. AR 02]MCF3140845.1 hypothetical protein [Paenarthrobacter sp. AR 02]